MNNYSSLGPDSSRQLLDHANNPYRSLENNSLNLLDTIRSSRMGKFVAEVAVGLSAFASVAGVVDFNNDNSAIASVTSHLNLDSLQVAPKIPKPAQLEARIYDAFNEKYNDDFSIKFVSASMSEYSVNMKGTCDDNITLTKTIEDTRWGQYIVDCSKHDGQYQFARIPRNRIITYDPENSDYNTTLQNNGKKVAEALGFQSGKYGSTKTISATNTQAEVFYNKPTDLDRGSRKHFLREVKLKLVDGKVEAQKTY
jgi:hypothetical protein